MMVGYLLPTSSHILLDFSAESCIALLREGLFLLSYGAVFLTIVFLGEYDAIASSNGLLVAFDIILLSVLISI